MNEHTLKVSRMTVRVVAIANLLVLGSTMLSPVYSRGLANGPFGGFLVIWGVATSLLLLGLVLFEAVPTHRFRAGWLGWWIDAALAFAWFLMLWGMVLHAFKTYGFP